MIITVFGTGSPTESGYREAYELGKKISITGNVLKNGGYGGTMEASAKGCKDFGGRSIGVCVEGHLFATAGKPNPCLCEVIIKSNLSDRIKELLIADRIVVLHGKIGTLEELFVTWADACVNGDGDIYLIGESYEKLMDFLDHNNFIEEGREKYIQLRKSIDDLEFLNIVP